VLEERERKQFGAKIKDLRVRYNYTQEEIAKLTGVTPNAVTNYEAGRRLPDYGILTKIAELFGVSVDYLLKEGNNDKWKQGIPVHLREICLDPENMVWIQLIPFFKQLGLNPEELKELAKTLAKIKTDGRPTEGTP
jgi:transcriptional regulator with XRE-family HTH domain